MGFATTSMGGNAEAPSTPLPNVHISSPLGAAIHSGPTGQPVDTIPHEQFDSTTWKINRKDTSALTKIDGDARHYKLWNSLMKDHVAENDTNWLSVLDDAE